MAFEVIQAINRDTDLWQHLKAIPKVELHRHMEGSIRLTTLVDVAQEFDIPLPTYEIDVLRPYVQITHEDEASSKQFLSKFSVLRQFFVDKAVICRVARETVEDAAGDNIRYMELRFTPYALAKLKKYPLYDVVDWVNTTVQETARKHDIIVNLIIAMNRHESVAVGEEMMRVAAHFLGRGVVAVDLCGNEVGNPADPFTHIFKEARQAGLGITIHAGEWAGPENVAYAIQEIGTTRIGHGVRSVEDSEILKLALDNNIYFEVCPTSNLQTGVVPVLTQHPLLDLHFCKANVTINTDDPAIHNLELTDEYALLLQGLKLPQSYLYDCILNAVRCSFLPDDEKAALEDEFRTALGLNLKEPER